MRVHLAYGMTGLEIDLPEYVNATVLEPHHVPGLAHPLTSLQEALRHPLGARPLRDLVRPHNRVGIIVSDVTRPAPNQLILEALFSELDHVRPEQITLFIATGTHRPTTFGELSAMLGAQIQASICAKAEVFFYSHNLTDDQLRDAWLKPCRSIEATLQTLLHKYGQDARVCVLPLGPWTIPFC